MTLDGVAATGVTVVSATIITATTSAHAAGSVSLVVTNPDGQSGTRASAFTDAASAAPPTISGLTPTSGTIAGATRVTISGTGFASGAAVTFGGAAATSVSVITSRTISARTPAHAAGPVDVAITNRDGQSATRTAAFTFLAAAPAVSSVSPSTGSTAGGTLLTLSGSGFLAGATVSVGGSAATAVSVVSASTITATTPPHAAGVVSIVVTNVDGRSGTRSSAFTYVSPAAPPTIANLSPTSGSTAGGTRVTIAGSGFASGATVTIGGTTATSVSVTNAASISVTTPAHTAGVGDVVVRNPDGQQATATNAFTFVSPTSAPTVTSASPSRGTATGGTLGTISGTGFAAGATVTIGGTSATGVVVISATSISVTTPAHVAGTVAIVVTNTDGQSGTRVNAFTFEATTPAPTLSAVSPNIGPTTGGTAVALTGTGFVAGATVTIGGAVATSVAVSSSTSISAATPADAAGTVNVTVALPDGQSATLAGAFTYTDASIDDWMRRFGITDLNGDDDGDGVNNQAEFKAQTDPTLPNTWHLAEGSTGFFRERLALANPGTDSADVAITFLPEGGSPVHSQVHVPPQSRTSITVNDIPGLETVALSTLLEAQRGGVVVERTMMWSNQSGDLYAGHTGRAAPLAQRQWFFAEGHAGSIDTWFSIANANAVPATLEVSYMLEDGQLVRRSHTMGANARLTVYANAVPELANRSFATVITSDVPVTADRTMYFSALGTFWKGGTAAAGLEAPALDWFVAEGHTGPFFDEYLLIQNPNAVVATATVRFLRPSGPAVVRSYALAPNSRATVAVSDVPELANSDVSAAISATQPIVVERAMYWPGPYRTGTRGTPARVSRAPGHAGSSPRANTADRSRSRATS